MNKETQSHIEKCKDLKHELQSKINELVAKYEYETGLYVKGISRSYIEGVFCEGDRIDCGYEVHVTLLNDF